MPVFQLGTLLSGIRTAESLASKVLSKKGTKIQDKINAVDALQRAINATRVFLNTNEYAPNLNLSNLWLDAFKAMIKIDKNLAARLRQKSKFWTNPESWLEEQNAMALVPDLNELNETCDSIMVELERRK